MTSLFLFITCFVAIYATCFLLYTQLNKGISKRSIHQQGFRFAMTSLLSSIPMALVPDIASVSLLLPAAITSLTWAITYPLLFHLTHRKSAAEYDHFMDINFGAYAFGFLSCLHILTVISIFFLVVASIIELIMLSICLFQIVYFCIYGTNLDTNGMKTIQETHVNEVIEFFHSFPIWKVMLGILLYIVFVGGWLFGNMCGLLHYFNHNSPIVEDLYPYIITAEIILLLLFPYLLFGGRKSVWSRTGLVVLWKNIAEYKKKNYEYRENMEKRIQNLSVVLNKTNPNEQPQTILMVIGESASRDYMSAFVPQPRETTPWLSSAKEDERHFLIVPHAYSCANQTVPTLERALTEKNLYNTKEFYESCSIIDIARKMGYRTHWYSNQGHLGSVDTPITLIAESCDVAKWTKQDLGKAQYDETLIDFLEELDPSKNNFLVLHLKGSHFNFINRYPATYPEAALTPKDDFVEQYRTSLHYTDHVLQQAFDYCQERLNLSCMFYFSDHGDLPLGRRSPNFNGFGRVRIPMFIYCSERYITEHPERYEAMRKNREKHFTNDLIYDLACGILDIRSAHFQEENSLASDSFRFTREMLLVNEGRTHISDDQE